VSEKSAGTRPLSPELLAKMDAYWRAANYLSVGRIYLKDNSLLERPLTLDDVKPRLLGRFTKPDWLTSSITNSTLTPRGSCSCRLCLYWF
jgi:phosphoketolase